MAFWSSLPSHFVFRRFYSNLYFLGFNMLSLYLAHYYFNQPKSEGFLWPIKPSWLVSNRPPGDFYETRLRHLNELKKKNHEFVSHPHKFQVNSSISELLQQFYKEETSLSCENSTKCSKNPRVAIAGRCRLVSLLDEAHIQFIVQQNDTQLSVLVHDSAKKEYHMIQLGDILGFVGRATKNQAGDIIFMAEQVKILAPTFSSNFHSSQAATASEQKRPRHESLLMNSDLRNNFFIRSKIISFIRRFLETRGFLEVETPLLIKMPKDAIPNRYVAHTVLNQTNYVLRISPELNLKKLIVGGFDRVFEIGRQFRNDKIDATHNPEYTTLEFYEAYADYYDMMQRTELLVSGLVKNLFGTLTINLTTKNKKGETVVQEVDFTPPFRRVQVMPTLEKALGVCLEPYTDLGSPNSVQKLLELSKKFGVAISTRRSRFIAEDVLDEFIGQFLESECIQPTFLYNYPEILSPTAKSHREVKGLSERFELIIGKLEVANAYTELNDPIEQQMRYQQESELRKLYTVYIIPIVPYFLCYAIQTMERGEELQIRMDPEYVEALEYGLAPTGGVGIGIDRLTMLFTNSVKIENAILFPQTENSENFKKN